MHTTSIGVYRSDFSIQITLDKPLQFSLTRGASSSELDKPEVDGGESFLFVSANFLRAAFFLDDLGGPEPWKS